jgi:hypothetical protein
MALKTSPKDYEAMVSCARMMLYRAYENSFSIMFSNEYLTYAHLTIEYMYDIYNLNNLLNEKRNGNSNHNSKKGENGNI